MIILQFFQGTTCSSRPKYLCHSKTPVHEDGGVSSEVKWLLVPGGEVPHVHLCAGTAGWRDSLSSSCFDHIVYVLALLGTCQKIPTTPLPFFYVSLC